MMRILWRLFVPGTLIPAAIWLFVGLFNVFGPVERPSVAIFDVTIALLNLYSWDYQRRRRGEQC